MRAVGKEFYKLKEIKKEHTRASKRFKIQCPKKINKSQFKLDFMQRQSRPARCCHVLNTPAELSSLPPPAGLPAHSVVFGCLHGSMGEAKVAPPGAEALCSCRKKKGAGRSWGRRSLGNCC